GRGRRPALGDPPGPRNPLGLRAQPAHLHGTARQPRSRRLRLGRAPRGRPVQAAGPVSGAVPPGQRRIRAGAVLAPRIPFRQRHSPAPRGPGAGGRPPAHVHHANGPAHHAADGVQQHRGRLLRADRRHSRQADRAGGAGRAAGGPGRLTGPHNRRIPYPSAPIRTSAVVFPSAGLTCRHSRELQSAVGHRNGATLPMSRILIKSLFATSLALLALSGCHHGCPRPAPAPGPQPFVVPPGAGTPFAPMPKGIAPLPEPPIPPAPVPSQSKSLDPNQLLPGQDWKPGSGPTVRLHPPEIVESDGGGAGGSAPGGKKILLRPPEVIEE